MTKLYLLDYECKRCHKIFRSYFEPVDDLDKQFLQKYFDIIEEGYLFRQVIKNERECRRCRKGVDLTTFGLHT